MISRKKIIVKIGRDDKIFVLLPPIVFNRCDSKINA